MARKGYTTRSRVAAELGITLDAVEGLVVDDLIEEAESYIDATSRTPYLGTSIVSNEPHVPTGDAVELLSRPVLSVTSVRVRSMSPGATPTTLTAGTDYELLDAAAGTLLVPGYAGQWVEVSYSFSAPVPPLIRRAATRYAAEQYRPRLLGTTGGAIESVTVGDVSVKYTASSVAGGSSGWRADVDDLIDRARRPIFT